MKEKEEKDLSGLAIGNIIRYRKGETSVFQSDYNNLNNALGINGFMPNSIVTVASASGGGQTSFTMNIVRSIFQRENNNAEVLIFNSGTNKEIILTRYVVSDTNIPVNKIYTKTDTFEDGEETFKKIKEGFENVKHLNKFIYKSDNLKVSNIMECLNERREIALRENKPLIYVIDNVLLINPEFRESSKDIISNLARNLILFREESIQKKAKTIGFVVVNIFKTSNPDKLKNNESHFSRKDDLGDAFPLDYASNFIIMLNEPLKLGLKHYGTAMLPVEVQVESIVKEVVEGTVKNIKQVKKKALVYGHIVKNDYNKNSIFTLLNNLEFYNFIPIQLTNPNLEPVVDKGGFVVKKINEKYL